MHSIGIKGHSPPQIVVVGGGLAGLRCAKELAVAGKKPLLIESKPFLGGRAASYFDPIHEELIDHCQHVSMGCCYALNAFCAEAGLGKYLKTDPKLHFLTPNGGKSTLSGSRLPAPFHLGSGFLKANFLNFKEKAMVALGLMLMRLATEYEDGPILSWLQSHFQSSRCIERFWSPVIVSALNTPIEKASFHYARKVFVDSFFQNRKAYELVLPTVPLGKLYGEEFQNWLKSMGATLQLGTAANQVLLKNGEVSGIRLANGNEIPCLAIVLAVPFQRIGNLIPPESRQGAYWNWIDELELSPITSVHLWFDKKITEIEHAVLLDGKCQWLFYKGKNTRDEHYYQVVISASGEMLEEGNQQILEMALQELPGWLPAYGNAKLLRTRVISEKQATFAVIPFVDSIRPNQVTPIPGLFLAGDYTQTGWPATMEGAVRSGYLASKYLLRAY